MKATRKWGGRATTAAALTAAGMLVLGGVAHADTLQDSIADDGSSVTLVAGSAVGASATIRVIGNNAAGDPDPGCNIDAGEAPLKLDIVTPTGVTANPDPLFITTCGTDFAVSFTASSSAVSGHATVTVLSGPAGGGTYVNQVDIPITVNTKPTVSVRGVTNGESYVIGQVPAATCNVTDPEDGTSSFAASLSGTLTEGLGSQTATCDYIDHGGLAADTATATYTIVAPPNTKPSVAVAGVVDGATYEIGAVPAATCVVTDAEDGNSTAPAHVTGNLSHGLGTQTATCDYTDDGGLAADTASASYTIVDTGNPTISHSLNPATPNGLNGWYTSDVKVDFTCDDTGSGIANCEGDTTLGEGAGQSVTGTATDWAGNTAEDVVSGIDIDKTAPTISHSFLPSNANANGWYKQDVDVSFVCADSGSHIQSCTGDTTLGEGANQSASGTATDLAGNTATDEVTGINIDKTAPTVGLQGGPGSSYYYGDDPAAPTCVASDGLSGVATCVITGGGTSIGAHTYTATATDRAGNTNTATLSYTVLAWTSKGFYSPVDMGGVWNTVKGGSTVPLKFEVFVGSNELTSTTTAVKSFAQKAVTCPGAAAATDDIEFVTTGGTALRYDATAGQFVQNWATPKKPGTCWAVTLTTQDGSTTSANFILK
jgi:hypothetical protein